MPVDAPISSSGLHPWPFRALAALAVLVSARAAAAHDPFEVTTDARVLRDRTELHVMMARDSVGPACAGPRFEAKDFADRHAELERCARSLFAVSSAGHALAATGATVSLTVEDDLDARIVFPEASAGPLVIDAVFIDRLPGNLAGAQVTATSEDRVLGQQLLNSDARTLELVVPASRAGAARSELPVVMPSFRQYLRLGVEHILTGYDHLLFLLGLLAACRRLRTLLGIVTCFTLAHSLTLALAALGVFALPSRVVEPLIAATIVFVGIENVVRGEEPRGRWLLAFTFGLVHGFGFASALAGIGLGRTGAPIVMPIFGFNLGVELGQAAVAALLLTGLRALRSVPSFERRGAVAVSLAVSAIGLFWLVRRVVGA